MKYSDGAIRGRGVWWVWSSLAYTCNYPCYIDRCVLTGRLPTPNPQPFPGPENTPRAIDGLEFA